MAGTSLVVQWLRLCAATAGGTASIPVGETKTLHAMWHGQRQKKKESKWQARTKFHLKTSVWYLLFSSDVKFIYNEI